MTKFKAVIWNTKPGTNGRQVDRDGLRTVANNTSLPIPVLIEFDPDKQVGTVEALSVEGDELHAVLDLNDDVEIEKTLSPVVGWKAVAHEAENTYEPIDLFAVGLTETPTTPGTWMEKDAIAS